MFIILRNILIGVSTVGLSACASTQGIESGTIATSNYTRVTTDEMQSYIDKKLTLKGNHFVISEDGTFSGNWNGSGISGTWEFKDGYWCRDMPSSKTPYDCQLWESDGDKLRVTRNKGKGERFDYKVIDS